MPSDEISLVETWIKSALLQDPDVVGFIGDRVFDEPPPRGTLYPYVIFNMSSADDVTGVGVARIFSDTMFTVKAVARTGNSTQLGTLAALIDGALTTETIVNVDSAGTIEGCVRINPVSYKEFTDGTHYEHRGGDYRIIVQAA